MAKRILKIGEGNFIEVEVKSPPLSSNRTYVLMKEGQIEGFLAYAENDQFVSIGIKGTPKLENLPMSLAAIIESQLQKGYEVYTLEENQSLFKLTLNDIQK